MGVDVLHTLPGGERSLIDSDVLDIGRRVNQGDALWRGDPSMALFYNELLERYEVWGQDLTGKVYLAASNETCDQQLLIKLAQGDWQRGLARFAELDAKNEKVRLAAEEDARGRRMEAADKFHWALMRDVGHLEGQRIRQHAVPSVKFKDGE